MLQALLRPRVFFHGQKSLFTIFRKTKELLANGKLLDWDYKLLTDFANQFENILHLYLVKSMGNTPNMCCNIALISQQNKSKANFTFANIWRSAHKTTNRQKMFAFTWLWHLEIFSCIYSAAPVMRLVALKLVSWGPTVIIASLIFRCLQHVRQWQWQTGGSFCQNNLSTTHLTLTILSSVLPPRALVINVSYSPHAALKTRAAYCFSCSATGPKNDTVK